ncbi:uncharacterized protein LOC144607457 [Rhinoraja longicauda]
MDLGVQVRNSLKVKMQQIECRLTRDSRHLLIRLERRLPRASARLARCISKPFFTPHGPFEAAHVVAPGDAATDRTPPPTESSSVFVTYCAPVMWFAFVSDLTSSVSDLTSFTLCAANDGSLQVIQSPPYLNATEGDQVNMTCQIISWNTELRIEWNKEQPEGKTSLLTSKWNRTTYYLNYSERMEHFCNETASLLTISRVELNDTGQYICQAIIETPPPVFTKSGNGTYLQVQVGLKENAISNGSAFGTATWILIGLLSSLALVITVQVLFLTRRFFCPGEGDPTYVNVEFRKKGGKNGQPTEQRNARDFASGRCGDLKTSAPGLPCTREGDLK